MGVPSARTWSAPATGFRRAIGVQAGDRRPEAAELATRCGAQWVSQIARLAAESDVLITVLPGSGEVREVMLGPGGVLEVLRRGTTWIDMTSNSPAAMTEIQQTLLARGVQVLEAPVGGGVAAATQETLQVLVGGDAEVFARQRDLLEILGDPGRVIHVGGYGPGIPSSCLLTCCGSDRRSPPRRRFCSLGRRDWIWASCARR